jgi:predicted nucleic acid-binding protein
VIAYFDSSSMAKWLFDEPFSELARDSRDRAEIVVTSLVAFPEVLSAINRACRQGRCLRSDTELLRDEFLRIWPDFQWIEVREELVQKAGGLIFKHSLRGFDAVHLASALLLKQGGGKIDLFFSCFDQNLNLAARQEGLPTHQAF